MNTYFVYILQSQKNGQYYIGMSGDVLERLKRHNDGRVVSTKYKRPWLLCFQQSCATRKEASQVEQKLKALKSRKIIDKVIQEQTIQFLNM